MANATANAFQDLSDSAERAAAALEAYRAERDRLVMEYNQRQQDMKLRYQQEIDRLVMKNHEMRFNNPNWSIEWDDWRYDWRYP